MEDKNVIKHFFNIGLGTVINVLLGFITTPYITRVVDPDVYGQLSIFDTYAGILLGFLYFGLDYALVRFFYDEDSINTKGQLFKFCILFPTIVACICFAVMYFLIKINVIDFRFSTVIFVLLIANVITSIWQKISTSLLRLEYKTKEYSISVVVQKIVYCAVIIMGLMFFKNAQLEVLICATILSFVGACLISYVNTKQYWNLTTIKFDNINKKEILKYGVPLVAFALSLTLLDSIDKLFIDYYCNEYEVGLYASAFTLVSMMSLIQTTFNSTWLPMQTEQFIKNPNDSSFIKKGNKYITLIMFIIGINVIMFKDVFVYLLGESYRSSAVYMPFLTTAIMMYTISDSTCSGIDMSKKSYLNIIVALLPCIFSAILLSLLVPIYGTKGAALARSLSASLYFAIRTFISNKYYYVDYDLKKFSIVTLVIMAFALEVTFVQNNILTIALYLVTVALFLIIYLKDIKELLIYFKSSLFSKK